MYIAFMLLGLSGNIKSLVPNFFLNMKKYNLALLMLLLSTVTSAQYNNLKTLLAKQRLIVIMFDGFGKSYYQNAPMPFLKMMVQKGLYKEVDALMPTVTNLNNSAICTGTFAAANGITGNSFLDAQQQEAYMESKDLLLTPTLFQKLQAMGIPSALIASKKKSISLLSSGSTLAVSPEKPDSAWIAVLGKPPEIYSAAVNYWTMSAAIEVLKNRPDIRCVYIHTTDYPMHMWPPEDSNSINHLRMMDNYIKQLVQSAPDAMVLITADHDVHHKSRCIDLEKALSAKGIKIKIAISAERDKYFVHHRGFGGTSYIYLKQQSDEEKVKKYLETINGVEKVLTKKQAAAKFHLMPARIGDLVVLGDSTTVFGDLEKNEFEDLPDNYRTHGSTYEIKVPLIIYNAPALPPAKYFRYNKDLTTWLFGLD